MNKVGDGLPSGGATFAADDDPELIKSAAPFSLKLMESVLAQNPRHAGLLLATASGFTGTICAGPSYRRGFAWFTFSTVPAADSLRHRCQGAHRGDVSRRHSAWRRDGCPDGGSRSMARAKRENWKNLSMGRSPGSRLGSQV